MKTNYTTISAIIMSAVISGGVLLTPAFAAPEVTSTVKVEAAAPAVNAEKSETMKDYVIVELNGEKIMYSQVQALWDELFPGEGAAPPLASFGDAIRDNIVRGLVSERLMLAEAERIKLDESDRVKERMEAMKRQILVQELLRERHKDLAESNVKKRYDELVKKADGKEEIRASHILVESEEEAEKLLDSLKDGKVDFALIAKEVSKDKGSAAAGGDLGYFTKEQMVPEFAEAAFELDKGELSDPVKSPFGWHLIKLQDRRDLPLPTLDEARPQIVKQLQAEADSQYVLDLLEDADINYYDADGKEIDFPIKQQAIDLTGE